jgi:hypothetical protein
MFLWDPRSVTFSTINFKELLVDSSELVIIKLYIIVAIQKKRGCVTQPYN